MLIYERKCKSQVLKNISKSISSHKVEPQHSITRPSVKHAHFPNPNGYSWKSYKNSLMCESWNDRGLRNIMIMGTKRSQQHTT